MPKTNKQSNRNPQNQRHTNPYSHPRLPPAHPHPLPRPISDARTFPPPPGFTWQCPNPAYPQYTLTAYELSQSLHDFIKDLQNGVSRPADVDEDNGAGGTGNVDGEGKGVDVESGGSGMGRYGGRREEDGEEMVGVDGVGDDAGLSGSKMVKTRNGSKGGGKRVETKRTVGKGKKPRAGVNQPGLVAGQKSRTGSSQAGAIVLDDSGHERDNESPDSKLPTQSPYTPTLETSHHSPTILAPPALSDHEIWLAELAEMLKPLEEFNARTPWPVPFHKQPLPPPAWHADCPPGYEPTRLAGYPLRRPYPLYIPAAHDPDMVFDQYGHYCLDVEPEWERCPMGKCDGCEICRPSV